MTKKSKTEDCPVSEERLKSEFKRRETRQIAVGEVLIGGGAPVAVQSMTKTDTQDVEGTVAQIMRLEEVGCEIARCAVPDEKGAVWARFDIDCPCLERVQHARVGTLQVVAVSAELDANRWCDIGNGRSHVQHVPSPPSRLPAGRRGVHHTIASGVSTGTVLCGPWGGAAGHAVF